MSRTSKPAALTILAVTEIVFGLIQKGSIAFGTPAWVNETLWIVLAVIPSSVFLFLGGTVGLPRMYRYFRVRRTVRLRAA